MIFNQIVTMKGAKLTLMGLSMCFLVIHIVMFFLFKTFEVYPMMYLNVFSMAFYVFALYMAHREWLKALSIAIYLEVVLHMTLAVCFVGWNCGFQITLIGMVALLFFSEYVGRILQINHVHALPLSGVGTAGYVCSYVVSVYYPLPYSFPPNVEFVLQVSWALIVFVIVAACLWAFVQLTFRSEVRLSTQAVHDALTGLPNRYYMSDYLARAVAPQDDGEKVPCWLAILDIDDFKNVNDTYGHNCGDAVLMTLANIIEGSVEGGEVCRWGGEEFLIAGVAKLDENGECDKESTLSSLDRLRVAISEYVFWHEEVKIHLTVTIGVAKHVEGQSVAEWVNAADRKLYEGKTNGKNQVVA